jgi:CTP:molybdopterin cytidylyltransferase MocA
MSAALPTSTSSRAPTTTTPWSVSRAPWRGSSRGDRSTGAVGAVVLAAGGSRRLGRPEQLLPLAGRPLLQHAIDAASEAGLADLVVVLGHDAEAVAAAIHLPSGAVTVVNPRYREGQSTSLRAGLCALAPGVSAALVLLGDQPAVSVGAIRAVVDAGAAVGATPIVQARYGGRPGHPVLLGRETWGELLQPTATAARATSSPPSRNG